MMLVPLLASLLGILLKQNHYAPYLKVINYNPEKVYVFLQLKSTLDFDR